MNNVSAGNGALTFCIKAGRPITWQEQRDWEWEKRNITTDTAFTFATAHKAARSETSAAQAVKAVQEDFLRLQIRFAHCANVLAGRWKKQELLGGR